MDADEVKIERVPVAVSAHADRLEAGTYEWPIVSVVGWLSATCDNVAFRLVGSLVPSHDMPHRQYVHP